MTRNSAGGSRRLAFNVHGRAIMGVAADASAAAQLRTMFDDFLTDDCHELMARIGVAESSL